MTERDDDTVIAQLERWAQRTEDAIAPFDPEHVIDGAGASPRRPRRRPIVLAVAASAVVLAGAALAWRVAGDDETSDVMTAAETAVPDPSAAASSVPSSVVSPATQAEPKVAALLEVDGCPAIADSDLRAPKLANLFGRTTPDGMPIQAVATPAGIEGPYAVVLRYFSATREPSFGDPVDVNGVDARVYVGPGGSGQISWLLGDGSEAYVRSRWLGRDELVALASALEPRAADATVAGFDVSGPLPADLQLVAEDTAPLAWRSASTSCAPAGGLPLRVGVVDASPAVEYAIGIDNDPLPVLQQRGEYVALAVSPDPGVAAAALGVVPPAGMPTTVVPPPSQPASAPRVSFTATRSAVGEPGCTAPDCRFVDVTLEGFPPGATVTVTCHSDVTGAFGSNDVTTDERGSATHEACYFGFTGERFYVSANGITSPTITWPP